MGYLKFSADRIFTGNNWLGSDKVLVTDGKGVVEAIIESDEGGEDVKKLQGTLSPGLVNAHCHLELSHLKGRIAEHTGLVDFVLEILKLRNSATEDKVMQAIKDAEDEMIRNGIVAVGDICNTSMTLKQKQNNNLAYYNFIEGSGFIPSAARDRMAIIQSVYNSFINDSPFERSTTIVPHAPYSVSDELWQLMKGFYQGKVVSLHSQESPDEGAFLKNATGDFLRLYKKLSITIDSYKGSGCAGVEGYYSHLRGAENALLVHNTFIGAEDIRYLENEKANRPVLCCCINANLYIEDTVPPMNQLADSGLTIVLGTDSLASNHSLSILAEMRSIRKHFPSITFEQMLPWATKNGAEALMLQHKLGSFEKNKKPGVICITPGFEDVIKLI